MGFTIRLKTATVDPTNFISFGRFGRAVHPYTLAFWLPCQSAGTPIGSWLHHCRLNARIRACLRNNDRLLPMILTGELIIEQIGFA